MADIDDAVFRELPLDIRHEIMSAMPGRMAARGNARSCLQLGGSRWKKRRVGAGGSRGRGENVPSIHKFFSKS
jgi:hypothetical protein